ncbi:MAG: O-antigen ligase family protein [Ilumatobacteraceae bacterium]
MPAGPSRGVPRVVHVERQLQNDQLRWWAMFATIAFTTVVIGFVANGRSTEPFSIALLVLIVACVAAFVRPVVGVYLILFLTLVGDQVTMEWWPFTKNMSSRESIFFVSDQLILNPLEVLAAFTLAAWFLQRLADPAWRFRRGALFAPVMVFTTFVVFGILRGTSSGGDTRVAIFEFRPLLYLAVVYVLITNLLSTRRQYRRLLLVSIVAISIQSIFSLFYYRGLPEELRLSLESLNEHAATIHMNALFVFLASLWLLRARGLLRWMVILLAVPVVYAYILSQRRAAMVALFVGLFMVVVTLYYRRRRAFWVVVPLSLVFGIGLILATWNAQGGIGLPAQAVKSAFFPSQLAEEDRASDLYRQIEAFDLHFTIRSNPLLGLGFGQKFYTPINLPDITFFEFWNYMPHNSILWIWIKMGFFGFVSMLFMFARAIQLGARSVVAVRTQEQVAIVLTGVTFIVMFVVFGYVDIAWGIRTTVFMALALAICGDYVRAVDDSTHATEGVHVGQLESVVR